MSLQRRGGRPRRSLLGRHSRRRREASRWRALSSGRRPHLPIDGPRLSLLEWHCVVTRRTLDVLRRFTKERDLPVSLRRRNGNDRRPRSVRRHERSSGHSRWHRDGWRRRPVVRFLGWCSGRRLRRRRCPAENADVPALRPTSIAFGGPELRTMYITSARFGLSEEELAAWPASGSVFEVDRATPGLPANVFRTDPWTDPR